MIKVISGRNGGPLSVIVRSCTAMATDGRPKTVARMRQHFMGLDFTYTRMLESGRVFCHINQIKTQERTNPLAYNT